MKRWRPLTWLLLSLACFIAAFYFWRLGDKWAAQKPAQPAGPASASTNPTAAVVTPVPEEIKYKKSASTAPVVDLNPPATNAIVSKSTNAFAYRLSNTTKTLGELSHNRRAILLENALIDAGESLNLSIPDSLRSHGDPGAYIVQANGPVSDAFRARLSAAGASIVSYIPNNAYLVRATAEVAQQLGQNLTVIPWEPYYKVKSALMPMALEGRGGPVNALAFNDGIDDTKAALAKMGATIVSESRSPFGTELALQNVGNVASVASLPGVAEVEPSLARMPANDLTRVLMGISTNVFTPTNYLNLSGKNVTVAVADTWITTNGPTLFNPDLPAGTLIWPTNVLGNNIADTSGHATHVAGVIAASGANSPSNAVGSQIGANFRGKAPDSKIWALPAQRANVSDAQLQQLAASTNALISNNGWNYGASDYNLAAASYDQAVRDSVPGATGSQAITYVFSAGNNGGGGDDGQGGLADSLLSPAVAKNVITVGASELPRNITNQVVQVDGCEGTNAVPTTNQPWLGMTDSSNQVARFSSRGNVGIGTEGDFGRFKPDVIAPGTFVVSTRSMTWDTNAYYNPVTTDVTILTSRRVSTNALFRGGIFVPCNATSLDVFANSDSPTNVPLSIRIKPDVFPTVGDPVVGTNAVFIPGDLPLSEVDTTWFYGIGNSTNVPVLFDLTAVVTSTNQMGDYWDVLRTNLNDLLVTSNGTGPFYRYESGTSIAAPAVAGTLALIEDYFTNQWHYTPSPALLKAMIINGARSINPLYNFQVKNTINYEGWGLVNISNSLPVGVTNTFASAAPMIFTDQDPTNALATGESRTLFVNVNSNAQAQPLRVTLVWTDPPGNPAVSIKLVNDLDLIVTNLDSVGSSNPPVVYFGNDIVAGNTFNLPWNTNQPPNSDNINNVENVYLPQSGGTNFSITVVARGVNVNAVTGHTNGVVQDYALVISSGDGGVVTNALTLTDGPVITNAYAADLTAVTNQFGNSTDTSGGILENQRVGASSPLQGTNTLSLTNQANWNTNGQITAGVGTQWHFYVITNTMGTNASQTFTNAAFITFLPVNLSLPPVGVNAPNEGDATRPEGDIDLYVARGVGAFGLTNLDPTVVAGATKSLSRGGTETLVFSNAQPNEIFYIGVKAEDQEAVEYSFAALFALNPFSVMGPNGEEYLHGINVPTPIPDGTPSQPGIARTLAIAVQPIAVRRVVVTNIMEHENFGDLFGSLTHDQILAVLNNHTLGNGTTNQTLIYEDNDEGDVPGSQHSDGPATLKNFIGSQGLGLWMLTEVDNAPGHIGQVDNVFMRLEPQADTNGVVATIQPGHFFYDFIDVPPEATNLTVCVNFIPPSTGPVQLYLRYGDLPTQTAFDQTELINNPGDCLSINRSSLPPLRPGRYYVGIFNPTAVAQTVRLTWTLELDPNGVSPTPIVSTNGITSLPDDAVTNNNIFITNNQNIVEVNVGVVLKHPRVSDLDLTLISPTGQRILLFENRGGPSATNMGHLNIFTNFFGTTTSGGANATNNVLVSSVTSGVLVIEYDFFSVPDQLDVYDGAIDIFHSGFVSGTGTFVIPYNLVNGNTLNIVMNQGNNPVNTTQWQYLPKLVSEDYTYLTFTDDTNFTEIPIKFALPPYDNLDNGTNFNLSDFESATNGLYMAPATIFDTNGGWTMTTNDIFIRTNYFGGTNLLSMATNQVSVVTDPSTAANGSNYLALANGSISRIISLNPAKTYTISYLYRGPGIAGWWRGEGNATDSSDPETLGNNGSLIGRFNFPAGEVGQAFALADSGTAFEFAGTNTYVQVQQSPSLDVGTGGGFTVEGWINPTNVTFQQPLVEWLAHVPTNTVVNGQAISNLVIKAGPFLNRANGHYYYLIGQTNWTTSELWANALGGHLAEVDDANEENWIYDTFAQFGGTNYTMWIGLTNSSPTGTNLIWSTGVSSVVYTNWAAGEPTNCSGKAIYTAILGPTNALPGLWTVLDNNGVTCDGTTNKPFGVVEVNEIQTNGVQFWISVTNSMAATNNPVSPGNGRLYANIIDTNNVSHEVFSAPGLIQSNLYQHVALTYSTNTGVAMLYYNGTNVATTNLGVFVPRTGGDVLIGKDMSRITNNFFFGEMDEMSIYSRFLSPAEIAAIYRISVTTTNRNIGKFDPGITPAESLAEAQVTFGGVTNLIYGVNQGWQSQGFSLKALSNSLPLQITGIEPGVLLDSFNLSEQPPGNLYYLPEQPLQALVGSNAFGNWQLEIRDARTGAISTNTLVSWELQFILQTNTPIPIQLSPQTAGTNTVPPGQIAYFSVFVPSWASFATNLLVSATAPVDLLFNQTTPPGTGAPGDSTFVNNGTSGGQTISNIPPSTPLLQTGQTYYLGVRNNGTVPSTVVVQVNFDITALTNGIPLTSRLNTNDLERPFIFNVSSNATEATFQLLQLNGNADLVLRKGLPLPNLLSADYGSFSGSNANETIYVLTNSLPVPLSAGSWYLDVIKRSAASDLSASNTVRYAVLAKELDPPAPSVISLTNRVPLNFTAGPGAELTNFFRFSVTNFPLSGVTNVGLRFELYNQSGNGDLTVQTNALPLAPPFFQSSQLPGNNAEIIFIRTNSALTNLVGDWFLGVPNNETNPISYTILAEIETNGFPAFPSAEGSGAITRGGASGTNVYHVTTLADSGPGSLRAAVTQTNGAETVVFDVSGTINLVSPLYITNSFLTIAGQTAPSNGVTVAGSATYVQGVHDIILRYLRFRAATNVIGTWSSGFEGQSQTFNATGYFAGGWHVDSGDIDLLSNGYGPGGSTAFEGNNYVDLDGDNTGTISTNVPTVTGQSYILTFAYSKNPGGSTASANVLQNGNPLMALTVNIVNQWPSLGWQTTSVVFMATSPITQLTFASQTPGSAGVLLDAISLTGPAGVSGADALQVTNSSSVIADHVSGGGLNDVSVLNSSNVTVQWSVLADSLNNGDNLQGGSQVRYGFGDVTYHHNLYANNHSANPRLGDNVSLDFVNNVVFNWGAFAGLSTNDITDNPGGFTNFLNYSANYFIAYNNSLLTNVAFWGGTSNTWIFQTNNFIDTNLNSILDGADTSWGMFSNQFTEFSHPFAIPPTAPDEAFIAYERVLDFAGTSLFMRDSLDRSVVQKVRILPAANTTTPLLSGMVSWWPAENNGNDIVGGNNGAPTTGVTYTNGEVGQAFVISGTNYVPVAPSSTLDIGTGSGVTIEGWIKPGSSCNGPIAEWDSSTVDGLQLWCQNGLQLFANVTGSSSPGHILSTGLGVLSSTSFQHVALTYDKTSGNAVLYLNGVAVVTKNVGNITPQTSFPTYHLNIGERSASSVGTFYYSGAIDELAIYNHALSQCEITSIYNAGSAGKQSILSGGGTNTMALSTLPYADVDRDGIPDFWEITLGENATNFSANLDRDGDGYTDLEEYMNWLGVPHALTITNTQVNVDLYQLSGNTGNLMFSVANGTNGTVYLTNLNACAGGNGNIAVFTPTNNFGNLTNGGFGSFTYTVTNTDTRAYFGPVTVSVFVSSVPITNSAASTNIVTFTNSPGDMTMTELTFLTVTNGAIDSNTNATLSYTVQMIIDTTTMIANGWPLTYVSTVPSPTINANGVISWTPSESQGPGVYIITTVATDNGAPPVSATNSFRVTVNESNVPPVFIATPLDQTNSALATMTVSDVATDSDIPPNPLTYALLNPPVGATVDANGVITWTPTPAQAPGIYVITNVVTDTNQYAINSKSLSATNFFTVYVLSATAPFAFTQPAQAVTGTSAQLNGMVTPNGLPTVAWFDWGTNTLYGSQTPQVAVGNSFNVVYFTNQLAGLTPNVPYHYRLVVSNVFSVVTGFDQILDEAKVVAWGADYDQQVEVPAGLSNVVAIAGAYDHSLALKNNGTVVTWGDHSSNLTNVPPGLNNVLAVAGANYTSVALRNNGTVTEWGGSAFNVTNVPAGLNNVVMISAGTYATLALQNNGQVVAWGANAFNVTNVPPGLNNVVEVASGSFHNLAIRNNGTVMAWGDNSAGQINVPATATNVVAIAGGNYHSLALRNDGTVVAWGDDNDGQTDVPPGLSNVVAVAAGGLHSLALRSDGSVVAWGYDINGQASVPLGLSNVVAISSGNFHSLALTPTLLSTNTIILDTTNGVPQTNSILPGSVVFYRVNVPTNADFATNGFATFGASLNMFFTTNTPPTISSGNDFLLVTNSISGTSVVSAATSPQLVAGSTYYLGIQNTNTFTVGYYVEVDFHLLGSSSLTNTVPITDIIHTNINGTNGFLLIWFAPSNDLFQVQWNSSLSPTGWNTFTNIVGYDTTVFTSPTNTQFDFFDDGSQTGGFGSLRYYRLILLGAGTGGLTNGAPATNSVAAGGVTFYQVNVPTNADFATNSLLSASGPLNIWFSTNSPPTVTNANDFLLITNATSGLSILTTVGSPAIVPGGSYYLGLQNTNSTPVTNAVQVTFHLTTTSPSTNTVPVSGITHTNINGTNAFLLVWFAPTNDLFQVQWAASLLSSTWNTFTNIISYDTNATINPTNSQFDFLDDGSQTGGVGPSRFYRLILLNPASSGVIPLTNGVPLNFTTGVGVTNFFSFDITQSNAAVLFELYNLSGNVDLTVQRSNLPVTPPYLASSTNPGTNYEQIVIRTNTGPANLNAVSWFLGVPNRGSSPISYVIRAALPTNGLLISGLPFKTTASRPGGSNVQLTWGPTVAGEKYEVRTNSNFASTNWVAMTDIVVVGTSATFTDPTPVGTVPTLFYRIAQVP